MDVDEGHGVAEEEGTVNVGGVDELGYFFLQAFGVGDLFLLILFLEGVVKGGDDVTVDLNGSGVMYGEV